MESQKSLLEFMDSKERMLWEKRLAYEEFYRSEWSDLHRLMEDIYKLYPEPRIEKGDKKIMAEIVREELIDLKIKFDNRPKEYVNQALMIWLLTLRFQSFKGYVEGFNVRFIYD